MVYVKSDDSGNSLTFMAVDYKYKIIPCITFAKNEATVLLLLICPATLLRNKDLVSGRRTSNPCQVTQIKQKLISVHFHEMTAGCPGEYREMSPAGTQTMEWIAHGIQKGNNDIIKI